MTTPPSNRSALVIGAGVSGLTVAVVLAERGIPTTIWSAEPPELTTSLAAGAVWGPYLVEPADKVERWSLTTLDILKSLATDEATGVHLVSGVEAWPGPADPPGWAQGLDNYRQATAEELPAGFAGGVRFTVPAVDMAKYLPYLRSRFQAASGSLEIRRIERLEEACGHAATIVNCSGVGARNLVPDNTVTAIRGQLVVIENPGVTEFFSEDTGDAAELRHYLPHGDTMVLGGTATADDWRLEPDNKIAAGIVARCAAINPAIASAAIIEHRVGLRPTRPLVRVEIETRAGQRVIHNYGHGGAGVSLSWGCALDVARLVEAEWMESEPGPQTPP